MTVADLLLAITQHCETEELHPDAQVVVAYRGKWGYPHRLYIGPRGDVILHVSRYLPTDDVDDKGDNK